MSESWDIDQAKEYLRTHRNTFSVRHFLGGAIAEVEMLRRANAVYLDAYSQDRIEKLEAENADLKKGFENMQTLHIDEKAEINELKQKLATSEKALKELKAKEIAWLKNDELRSRIEAQMLLNKTIAYEIYENGVHDGYHTDDYGIHKGWEHLL